MKFFYLITNTIYRRYLILHLNYNLLIILFSIVFHCFSIVFQRVGFSNQSFILTSKLLAITKEIYSVQDCYGQKNLEESYFSVSFSSPFFLSLFLSLYN